MHVEPETKFSAMKHRILVCACAGSGLAPEDKVRTLLRGFSPPDAEVVPVADLCRLAARDREQLAQYADAEKLTVVACFPRTVKSLLKWAEAEVADDSLQVHNLRTGDPLAIRQLIEAECAMPETPAACGCNGSGEVPEAKGSIFSSAVSEERKGASASAYRLASGWRMRVSTANCAATRVAWGATWRVTKGAICAS